MTKRDFNSIKGNLCGFRLTRLKKIDQSYHEVVCYQSIFHENNIPYYHVTGKKPHIV